MRVEGLPYSRPFVPASLMRVERALRNTCPARPGPPRTVDLPKVLLLASVVVWCSTFAVLVYLRHARFHSLDLDTGVYDQAIWLLARGRQFIRIRGLSVFGQHASPAFLLLAPFSWLGAGPAFLNVLQVLFLGIGAVAVYHAARFHLRNDWMALGLGVAFLLHPSTQWFAQELFHPEVMALAPLLFAYVAALHRRWHWFIALSVFAVAWKEDVALAVAALGIVLLLRKEWRAGAFTVLAATVWFLFATQVLVAHQGEGVFYAQQYYGDFGSTTTGIARTIVTRPGRVIGRLGDADALGYVRDLTGPQGYVAFLSPLPLLVGLPQAFFNLISVQHFTWSTDVHYAALPLVAVTLATVEGAARARRPQVRWALVALVLVSAGVATVSSGAAPVSRRYETGVWPLDKDADHALKRLAVEQPPRTAVVSASYKLVPHLAHREGIYSFPNPWILTNWGQKNEGGPDPRAVEWLVVDVGTLKPQEAAVLRQLVASGEFRVVTSEQGIVTAVRESYCRDVLEGCG